MEYMQEEDPSEDMGSLLLGSLKSGPESVNEIFETEMQVSKGTLRFKVDTGADASAISDKHLDLMGIKETEIKQTRKNLIGPGGEKLLEWKENPADHICVQKFAETPFRKASYQRN